MRLIIPVPSFVSLVGLFKEQGIWDQDTEPTAQLSWMKNDVCHAKGVIAVTPASGPNPSLQVTRTQKDSAGAKTIYGMVVRRLFEISIQWLSPDRGGVGAALGIAVEVAHVHVQRQAKLPEVALALCGLRGGLRTRQCRKQQGRQNCRDGDDHQKFDEREAADNDRPGAES